MAASSFPFFLREALIRHANACNTRSRPAGLAPLLVPGPLYGKASIWLIRPLKPCHWQCSLLVSDCSQGLSHKLNFALSTRQWVSACVSFGRGSLRGEWRDRDTNDIFAHCSLIFYFLDFKFSNFVCPSVLHRLIWFFLKKSFRKRKNIRKITQNALAPSFFIVLSIALKLGTPLLHIQAQNNLLQNF